MLDTLAKGFRSAKQKLSGVAELTDDVMSYERSLINTQVENGIATRMAVLYSLSPETKSREEEVHV